MEEKPPLLCKNLPRCNFKRERTANFDNDRKSLFNHQKHCKKIPKLATIIYRWRDNEEQDTGLIVALLLHRLLLDYGIDCYLDTKTLQTGDNLKETVKDWFIKTNKVLLLLTPRCFDRIVDSDDFFRFEIMEAFKMDCKILPIVFYTKTLPQIPKINNPDLEKALQYIIKDQLVQFFDAEHPESTIQKLVNELQLKKVTINK